MLNGIAYDANEDVFYLTGKWWPKFYKGACVCCMTCVCVDILVVPLASMYTTRCSHTPQHTHDTTTVKMCGLSKDAATDGNGVCAVNSAGGK